MKDFGSLPLHDATLTKLEFDLPGKICRIELLASVEPNHHPRHCALEFEGVSMLSLPQREPWGPSSSINSASEVTGGFSIEMQSGDVIEIEATHASFSKL